MCGEGFGIYPSLVGLGVDLRLQSGVEHVPREGVVHDRCLNSIPLADGYGDLGSVGPDVFLHELRHGNR